MSHREQSKTENESNAPQDMNGQINIHVSECRIVVLIKKKATIDSSTFTDESTLTGLC